MNKLLFLLIILPAAVNAQSFHPAPGNPNSNAIKKDSSCFVGWASGGSVIRGFLNIADTTVELNGSNKASFGTINAALGPATGSVTDVLSLGDSGIATLTFDQFIMDGPGYDFAIFENGFMDNYMEFAHVEVSSDGIHFFRFPSTTEIPLDTQLGNGSFSDCRMVNNLAGKYRVGYGTPFDLDELPDNPDLDKNAVRYVRIIDVIGDISGDHSTADQYGAIINDPFPTPFESGGFDLEAVGIINGTLGLNDVQLLAVSIFPNPASEYTKISLNGTATLTLFSQEGRLLQTISHQDLTIISMEGFAPGTYHLSVAQNGKQQHLKILKK